MRIFDFADFSIETGERVLYRDGLPIPLAPKIFDTLLVLVENHGRLVTKEALMTEVWRDTFVEENNLTQYVFVLRKIFGENSNGRKFIETVPRRGYRFVAEVRERQTEGEEPQVAHHGQTPFETSLDKNHLEKSNLKTENDTKQIIFETSPEKEKTESFKKQKTVRFGSFFSNRTGLIFAVCVLIIIGGVSFVWRRQPKAWSPENIKFKHLTEPGNYLDAAISPDGNSAAYIVRGKRGEIRLKNIQTDSEITIAQADYPGFSSPHFSPDGNFIYYNYALFGANGTVFRVPILGGEAQRVAEDVWSGFSISPDGKQIAFPRKFEAGKKHFIIVAGADGSGNERVLATREEPDYFALWGPAPAWSADGAKLTTAIGNINAERTRLLEIDLQSGAQRELELQDHWRAIGRLEWANGSNELFIIGQKEPGENQQLWRISFPGGAATRITNDSNDYASLSLSKDANRIAAAAETFNFHLWLFDSQTNQAKQLTFGANRFEGNYGLAFGPDNRIYYTARDKNEYNIFSMNTDGGDVRQLTKNAGRFNVSLAVSPDGKTLAFVSNRQTAIKRIWLMNIDGSNPRRLTRLVNDAEVEEETPYFSPDSRFIYYTFYRAGSGAIRKISVDGGGEPVEVRISGAVPVVSPDERELAVNFLDNKSDNPWQIRIQPLSDGGATQDKLFNFPAWFLKARWLSGVPHTLVTADPINDGNNLWQTDYETGNRRQITNFSAERIDNFDVSPDGKSFIIVRGNDLFETVLIER